MHLNDDGSKESLIPLSETEFVTNNFPLPLVFFNNEKGQDSYVKESSPFELGIKIK